MTRIYITGLGAITPIGNDVQTFWQHLVEGQSGAGRVDQSDSDDMPYVIFCEAKGFDPTDYMERKLSRRIARATQFAIAASRQAVQDAGLAIDEGNRDDVGVLMASGAGGILEIEDATREMVQKGWRSVGPFVIPSAMANAVSCLVSIEMGTRGPVMTNTAACASGNYAILEGYHFLHRGEARAMIVGGTEAIRSALILSAFGRMGTLSSRTDDPQRACRPFSVDRDGFVAGEGAAAFVLETEEHARQRGARLYAEVLGGALTGDAYHITAPDPSGDGAVRAMDRAIRNAGLQVSDVDVIFAHGTGTKLNDRTESAAIQRTFGAHTSHLKVTSIKSMTGHTLGAAGAMSALAAVFTLRTGMVPPTINYTPDPELAVPIVGNQARQAEVRHAMVNAFGFGGQNVALILGQGEA